MNLAALPYLALATRPGFAPAVNHDLPIRRFEPHGGGLRGFDLRQPRGNMTAARGLNQQRHVALDGQQIGKAKKVLADAGVWIPPFNHGY
jgi:hypothetical protein